MTEQNFPVSGVVLAGGQSRRMGRNKAFVEIGGQSIIERVLERISAVCQEVILVTNTPDEFVHLHYPSVPDILPGKGSLGGVYSGLKAASHPYALTVACDMPFLNVALLRYLILIAPGYDVIVPRTEQGSETLHAVYGQNCLPAMEQSLRQNMLRVNAFYPQVRVRYVDTDEIDLLDPQHLSLFNVNSPDDLAWAQKMAQQESLPNRHKRRF
ncbi:MAG: molybdenum cofactor guanylyltransferase [Chloroflexota bacterium]